MRVQIDESGADDKPLAIDHARLAFDRELADRDDAIVFDRDIADFPGLIAAVIEHGAAEDDVGIDGGRALADGAGGEGEEGECKHGVTPQC